jgi:hypothetical protein
MTNSWTIVSAGTSRTIGHHVVRNKALPIVRSARLTDIGFRVY